MEPIIGLLTKGQALLDGKGKVSLGACLSRVAEMCGRHGFSPAGVTMSPRLMKSGGEDRGEVVPRALKSAAYEGSLVIEYGAQINEEDVVARSIAYTRQVLRDL